MAHLLLQQQTFHNIFKLFKKGFEKMKKYEIPDRVKKNILLLLDRVEYKGLNEVLVAVEIIRVLENPVIEANAEQTESKTHNDKI